MNLTEKDLVGIAHHYYPTGFPVRTDSIDGSPSPFERTTEFLRWKAAWERAYREAEHVGSDWERWDALLAGVRAAFPDHQVGDATQPRTACLRCCVYASETRPDGGQYVTRVVGAVSVLAPLYLVYVTTTIIWSRTRASLPHLTFEPTGEAKHHMEKLRQTIERIFQYKPFPMELAGVLLPDIRVYFLTEGQPTLLAALFQDGLDNLP